MALRDIQETIGRDTRDPIRQVCLRLVDRLAAISADQLQRLTFTILADFAETSPDADELHSALTALTTMKHSPLQLYFVFYDAEDDREIAIPASDVMQAVDEDIFVHPRTGEEVPDFARQLKPVYKATREFADAIARGDEG
jgi:hypothetical protein